jgi:hypothetical protein
MSFVGRLEDLRLGELLQVLSLFRKSGKLTISHGDATGVFLLNSGKMYHAANGFSAPSVGEYLLSRKLISRETLDAALATQRLAPERKKLGAILVEMGAVSAETLDQVLRDQLQKIANEFMKWDSGFFSFKTVEPGEVSQEEIDDETAKLTEVVSIDPFILDLLAKVDAVGGDGSVRPVPRMVVDGEDGDTLDVNLRSLLDYMVEPGPSVFLPDPSAEVTEWPSDLSDLRTLMSEIHHRPLASSGEIALLTLRYATKVVNRGVLFGVSPERISGIGQFGVGRSGDDSPNVTNRIRHVQIPVDEPSVFSSVIERKSSYHGRLEQCPWNNYLVDQLGGTVPPEVIVTPIVVNGNVAVIFYGDSLPGGHPITSTHGLELLMIEAGLAIERNLLAEKMRKIEERLRTANGKSSNGGGETQ